MFFELWKKLGKGRKVGSSVTSDVEKDEKIVNPPPSIHSSFLDPPSNMDEEKFSSVRLRPVCAVSILYLRTLLHMLFGFYEE
jgi:hypothetical protein